ncbi:hypothetical protein ACFQV4_11970 [Streptomyces thermocarboxydus]
MTATRTPRATPPPRRRREGRAGRRGRAAAPLRPATVPVAVLLVLALLPYSALDIPVLLDGPVNSPARSSCSPCAWSSARSPSATT